MSSIPGTTGNTRNLEFEMPTGNTFTYYFFDFYLFIAFSVSAVLWAHA